MTEPALKPQLEFEFPSLDFEGRTALTPAEVAARSAVSVEHVFDLIDEGQIKAIDWSGKNNLSDRRTLRIPREAYLEFLRARTV